MRRSVQVLFLVLFSIQAAPAQALRVAVTNTNDSGPGSLRDAVAQVNASSDTNNVITFNLALPATITLTSGQLDVTNNVSIIAPGSAIVARQGDPTNDAAIPGPTSARLTISGNNASRIFKIEATSTTSLMGLTLTEALGADLEPGGAIDNLGTLNLTRVVVSNSFCIVTGGGISNEGTLSMNGCLITGNHSNNCGAGIFNLSSANLTVANSTISTNGNHSEGGGICSAGSASINNSTITGNSTFEHGGGLQSTGSLTLSNSTISNNNTEDFDASGAGLSLSGTAYVTNCTVSGNTALNTSRGAGILVDGTVTVTNSTIAENIADGAGANIDLEFGSLSLGNTLVANPQGGASNCTGYSPGSLGHNLDSDGTCNLAGSGDQSGTTTSPIDPKLGPLQNNGGRTATHALLPGSPAIDTGDNAILPSTPTIDQRGLVRIVDGNADGVAVIDIGAYEVQSADLGVGMTAPSSVKSGATLTYSLTVTNLGPATAEGVVLSDALPAGTTFLSASTSLGTLEAPPPGSSGTVTFHFGSLPPNPNAPAALASITVTVTAPAKATLSNTATVSAITADPAAGNNSATATTVVTHR